MLPSHSSLSGKRDAPSGSAGGEGLALGSLRCSPARWICTGGGGVAASFFPLSGVAAVEVVRKLRRAAVQGGASSPPPRRHRRSRQVLTNPSNSRSKYCDPGCWGGRPVRREGGGQGPFPGGGAFQVVPRGGEDQAEVPSTRPPPAARPEIAPLLCGLEGWGGVIDCSQAKVCPPPRGCK